MAIIKSLKDKMDNIIYPKTKTSAIYDDSNNRLDHTLKTINENITSHTHSNFATREEMEQKADKEKNILKSYSASNQAELDNILNSYSVNLENGTDYEFSLWVKFSGTLSGGTYKISGTKIDAQYETQEAKIYSSTDNIKFYARSKTSGTWEDWSKLATQDKIDISSTDLQNGWVNVTSMRPFTVAKSGNIVSINAWIKDGVTTTNTPIYMLPKKFKPINQSYIIAKKYNSTEIYMLIINSNGDVTIDNNIPWTKGEYYINGTFITI